MHVAGRLYQHPLRLYKDTRSLQVYYPLEHLLVIVPLPSAVLNYSTEYDVALLIK